MLCRTGGDSYTTAIVGSGFAIKDSFDGTELMPHLLNHLLGSTAHGSHRQAAEEKRYHAADEHSHNDLRVHEVDLEIHHEVGHRC